MLLNSNAWWVVYFSEKISVQVLGTGLGFSKPFNGWIRVTTTGKKDTSKSLDKYSQKIPLGAKISYQTEETAKKWGYSMNFEFITVGKGPLLTMALPH